MLMTKERRTTIRTVRGWAIAVLQEAGAIRECEYHGWIQDRSDPHARERALEIARSFKPDLMVVDLIMPQADGLEVATQLEADWALHEVPIVFVTALITPEEARGGRRINGHRVVPKPTRGFDLIRVVEENLPCCSGA